MLTYSLDRYLREKGFSPNSKPCQDHDGYITEAQKKEFASNLKNKSKIEKIAEIGFNGGHSAEHFFKICKNLKQFVAFDINIYPITRFAVEYFYHTYPDRFLFILGDSLKTVPVFQQKNPSTFDLIYIDGCHHFEWAVGDIMNTRHMAHSETILWIDDVEPNNPVSAAIRFCESLGVIEVKNYFNCDDSQVGLRSWVEARFLGDLISPAFF